MVCAIDGIDNLIWGILYLPTGTMTYFYEPLFKGGGEISLTFGFRGLQKRVSESHMSSKSMV